MLTEKGVHFLAIEGAIGVGKTSLAEIIANRWKATLIEENFRENPFLEKFYQNKEAYAFQTQLFFLLDRLKQLQESAIQSDLFRDLLISDYTYDKDQIFAAQNLTESEYAMYDQVAKALNHDIPRPDLVVYLQASVPTLLKRIHGRGRAMEKAIEGSYLNGLLELSVRSGAYHQYRQYRFCPQRKSSAVGARRHCRMPQADDIFCTRR